MKCPKCSLDAIIMRSETRVFGDSSPEEETRVFSALIFSCRNPACEMEGKEVGQTQHQIYPAIE